jgi:hypothetical protein
MKEPTNQYASDNRNNEVPEDERQSVIHEHSP